MKECTLIGSKYAPLYSIKVIMILFKKIFQVISIIIFSPLIVCGQSVQSNSNVEEIIVICKTHFDIGFTHRVNDIVKYYRTSMIDKSLGIMDASGDLPEEQQFAWTLPGWVLSKTLDDWDGQTIARKQKLEEKFRSGKIMTHALPFTSETDACEVEALARGMVFASELTHKYNLPLPRSGKLTDVPSHGNFLATVLANADVKFLHIGCNWPSIFIDTPGLYWWEGPDKSRVLTFYSTVYGTFLGKGSDWRSSIDYMLGENLLPPSEWPYKVWPAILVTIDNSGPPTAEYIKSLLDEVKEKMPNVKVRMGTMDDFYNAIMKENPEIPVIKEEMPDTWIHGIMCDPEGTCLSRKVNPQIASAEVLNTQLQNWGVKMPSIEKDVADIYEKIALYGEHTWGGSKSIEAFGDAFNKLPKEEYADLEASWEDKTDYIRDASKMTQSVSDLNMSNLAKSVACKVPSFIVYNPLPWERSGSVEIEGKTVHVSKIPPCGYRTFPLKELKAEVSEVDVDFIENEFFKISFDAEKGIINSLLDKRTGREWVDKDAEKGLGQYLNERFTFEQTLDYTMNYQQGRAKDWPHPGMHKPGMISEKEVPYRAASSKGGQLSIKKDGIRQMAELLLPSDVSAHLPVTILRVTLVKNEPYVDMEITIKDKARDNWPEADWLCLPFKIDNPIFKVYRPLGVMNPSTDIISGANRHLYSVGNGVTITEEDGAGIAVCPLDHPLISLDTPGCWKFSYDFVPHKPIVYLNLYNNQWNTNFRYWYPGTWSSRVRLWTIDKGQTKEERDRNFTSRALEARNPLSGVISMATNGGLPAKLSGVKVSRKGVLVTALGSDPYGNEGTLIRIWEQAGQSGDLTVTLPKGMNVIKAIPVNLRGEIKGEPIPVKNGIMKFGIKGYAPASFILQ